MAIYKNNEQSIKETLVLNSNEGDRLFPSLLPCMVFQELLHKLTQELLELFAFSHGNQQSME